MKVNERKPKHRRQRHFLLLKKVWRALSAVLCSCFKYPTCFIWESALLPLLPDLGVTFANIAFSHGTIQTTPDMIINRKYWKISVCIHSVSVFPPVLTFMLLNSFTKRTLPRSANSAQPKLRKYIKRALILVAIQFLSSVCVLAFRVHRSCKILFDCISTISGCLIQLCYDGIIGIHEATLTPAGIQIDYANLVISVVTSSVWIYYGVIKHQKDPLAIPILQLINRVLTSSKFLLLGFNVFGMKFIRLKS